MTLIFTTLRLRFRLMEPADEAALELLDGDPQVRAFFPGGVSIRPTTWQRVEDNRASYASHGFSDFVVEDKASGEFVGRAGFRLSEEGEVEAGYVLLAHHWGRGFATEALQGLLGWIKPELVPRGRVIAYAPTEHRASLRVMQKCGMTPFKTATFNGVACTFCEIGLPR